MMFTQSSSVRPLDVRLPRLLVSVRDTIEAEMAIDAGVRLIDVKEPAAGSLGAASVESIREIADVCRQRVLLSVALGELLEEKHEQLPRDIVPAFVKSGLSGCRHHPHWPALWEKKLGGLRGSPVAVVYADSDHAQAPSPSEVVRHAISAGCQAVLLDTFDKTQGNLLVHMTRQAIRDWTETVHAAGMKAVVAGSIDRSLVAPLLEEGIDCVAVRGAACRGNRLDRLDPEKLAQLVHAAAGEISPA
tara:strand:+ start:1586 stop:2323 length:738 start_codon:yes stop_codon:yes gene_type:complete